MPSLGKKKQNGAAVISSQKEKPALTSLCLSAPPYVQPGRDRGVFQSCHFVEIGNGKWELQKSSAFIALALASVSKVRTWYCTTDCKLEKMEDHSARMSLDERYQLYGSSSTRVGLAVLWQFSEEETIDVEELTIRAWR